MTKLILLLCTIAHAWNDHYDEEDDAWVLKIIIPILLGVVLICVGGCFYQSYIREKTREEEEDIYGNDKPPSYLNKQKYLPNIQPASQIYQAETKPYLSQHKAKPHMNNFQTGSNCYDNFQPYQQNFNQNQMYQQFAPVQTLTHTQSAMNNPALESTYGTLPMRKTTQSYNTLLNKPHLQSLRPSVSYGQEPGYPEANYANQNLQIQHIQNQQLLSQGRGVNPSQMKLPRSTSFMQPQLGNSIYGTLPRQQTHGIFQSQFNQRNNFRQRHSSVNGILEVPDNFKPDVNLLKGKKVNFLEDSGVSLPSSGASIEEASIRSNSPKFQGNFLPGASELARACGPYIGNGQFSQRQHQGNHQLLSSRNSGNSSIVPSVRRSLSLTDISRPVVQRRMPEILGASFQPTADPYLNAVQTAYEQFQPRPFNTTSRRSSVNNFLERKPGNGLNGQHDTTIYL